MQNSFVSISRARCKTEALPEDVYDRQSLAGIDQAKLKAAKIGCVGAGGLGSWYIQALARMGVGSLIFCDGDVIEPSNLSRQYFYFDQLPSLTNHGNKALSLQRNLKRECTGATLLEAYPSDFQQVLQKYPDAFTGMDLIACLVDNDRTRYYVSSYGLAHNTPVIFAGVSRDMLCGHVFIQTNEGACFHCIKPKNKGTEHVTQDCRDPAALPIHKALMGIATYAAISIVQGEELTWNYYGLILNSDSIAIVRPKRDDCELCGNRRQNER